MIVTGIAGLRISATGQP